MKDALDPDRIPRHIAIIMDGNGRWAKKKGAMRIFGHHSAINAVREAIEGANELGVEYLTLFSFSTENWSRPKEEINALMELLVKTIVDEVPMMLKGNIRLLSIGDINSLHQPALEKLEEAKRITSDKTGMKLVLALSYSGQWELTQATRHIAQKVSDGKLKPEDITPQVIADHLETCGIPDPELMIRTSGEFRISNFLLWQLAYTELHF